MSENLDDIKIRIAAESDLPDILALYSQLERDETQILPIAEARAIYDRMKSYPDYGVYVAEAGGRIVGTFALAIMDNLAHMGAKSGLIEDVAVSADMRGHGVGTEMMRYAVRICGDKSCYKVSLSSNVRRETAHKFYEKLGFKIHGYSFTTELEN